MKRTLRALMTAVAAIIVVGSVASASPSLRASFGLRSSATSASGATGVTGVTGASGATGTTGVTGATGAVEAIGAVDPTDGTGPDFSGCAGLTGLDNAICRHEVLLAANEVLLAVAANPDNQGLANSLAHLMNNATKHAGDTATTESSSSGDLSSCPGHSCDPHGHSGDPHGNSGGSHGHGNG